MARPSKFDRDDALNRAMDAIWKDGFEQSSVKALSGLLGITRSSFYNAFGSREALFREALPGYAEMSPGAPLYRQIEPPVLPVVTQAFHDICRARADDPDGRGCMIINTVCELCPDTEGLGAVLAADVLGSAARMEALMAMARDNGEIPETADPHALGLALQNLMVGLNVFSKVVRDGDELWLLTRTTLEGLGLYREPDSA